MAVWGCSLLCLSLGLGAGFGALLLASAGRDIDFLRRRFNMAGMQSGAGQMPESKNKGAWIAIIFMLVIGLVFTAVGAGFTYVSYNFSQKAVATSGIVTDVEVIWTSNSSGSGSSPSYRPTISYIDESGTPQSGQTFLSASGYNYTIGTKLPILYDPATPGTIRMDSWFALWGFGLVFLLSGLLTLAGALLVRVIVTKKARINAAPPAAPKKKTFSYSSNTPDKTRTPTVRRK